MEHENNETINLNAQVINDKNDSLLLTYDMPEEGLLSKFSIKISKKRAPAIPNGFSLWD